MLLQRIKAINYRTYLLLDLDLTVDEDRPLVLIGGANGGGKTTLFNAIAGALYGLYIPDAETFHKEMNAGALANHTAEPTIQLELRFLGQVLNVHKQYILTRTWSLNSQGQVVWGVKLNLDGNVLSYGSATPEKERIQIELEVNKVIKGNLPKELSKYFLFDAMTSGEKLSEDQLGKVIRENIENVMGLRKYMDLATAARQSQQERTAARIKAKTEREAYLTLVTRQRESEGRLRDMQQRKEQIREELALHKEIIAELKNAKDQETATRRRLDQLTKSAQEVKSKELHFRSHLDDFMKGIEKATAWPYLAHHLQEELHALLDQQKRHTGDVNSAIESLDQWLQRVLDYLETKGVNLRGIGKAEVIQEMQNHLAFSESHVETLSLEPQEMKALEDLLRFDYPSTLSSLDQQREELNTLIANYPAMQNQMNDLQAAIAGKDYSPMLRYEQLTQDLKSLELELETLRNQLADDSKKISQYDVTPLDEPDPKYEAVCRLKEFFDEAADTLLVAKKARIEVCLKEDLNRNLAAYRNVIERVELSENLRNLSFKIFHKAGNEIYLGQLNAASKQVVIQVLLKALHESGDYDPPVMIDTVMGVLDRESRSTVLEHYFPSLSHQTILLSTDSEIDPAQDLQRIQPFISKMWTLVRDRDAQCTTVESGYFGYELENV